MLKVPVKQNETLLDIAVLQSGDWTAVFTMALVNNISITKDLKSGDQVEPVPAIDTDVVAELKSRSARPASAIVAGQAEDIDPGDKSGIGFWHIEKDFVVS